MNENPSAEPKPCPFCGNEATTSNNVATGARLATCHDCELTWMLIEDWNRRTPQPETESAETPTPKRQELDAKRYRFLREEAFLRSPNCREDFAKLADVSDDDFDKAVDNLMSE